MPEHLFQSNVNRPNRSPNWGAVWAGMFTFVAIWSVFGLLGEAVFASAANPGSANPMAGMGLGIGIWAAVLTIIAMFVAGRITGHLAGVDDKISARLHGMIMFGLSVCAALVVIVLASVGLGTFTTAAAGEQGAHALNLFAGLGWIGFVSLFLGWLAALGGASSAIQGHAAEPPAEQVRRAAAA